MPSPVLQVITDTDRRGAQVFATDLHAALLASGHHVETVALAPGATRGLDVDVLGTTRLGAATLRSLRRRITASSVVLAHGSSTLPACALASLGVRVPFVYRQISDSLFWASTPSRRVRVRVGLMRASRIVALWSGSASTLTQHFGVAPEKLRVIPNGVPPERFAPLGAADRARARVELGIDPAVGVVACVGALAAEKGVDLAIRALADIDDAVLVVAGAGPERDRLGALAERTAPGRIVFTGSLADPRAVYAAADVVVLPSRGGDSMPATLIEAGLLGLPSVSTPVNGIPDIVVDGSTGELVPIGDLAALTRAVRGLLDDSDRARRLGGAARVHCAGRFAIDVVAAQWAAVIAEVAPLAAPGTAPTGRESSGSS